jgi:hypothetical protein
MLHNRLTSTQLARGPRALPTAAFALRRRPALGLVLSGLVATLLGGCELLGIGDEAPKKDTAVVDPCDLEPYLEGCPCFDDPTQDFCPDPCSLEPPAAQCVDGLGGDALQDAADTADTASDAKPDAKPDVKPDTKDTGGQDGDLGPEVSIDAEDSADLDDATEPDQAESDVDEDADVNDALADLGDGGGGADSFDASADLGPTPLPDSWILSDGAVIAVPPEAQWDTWQGDGSDTGKNGGALYLPDGLVIPVAGPGDSCQSDGECVGPPKNCQALVCLSAKAGGAKTCQYAPLQEGLPCSDGNACSEGDSCQAGECKGWAKICADKDSNLCTISSCDPSKGCVVTNAANDTPCNDGNSCTDADSCFYGKCKPGSVNKCECTKTSDCLAFDDGNLCNGEVKCIAGTCMTDSNSLQWFDKVANLLCDPSGDKPCLTNLCNPKNGQCQMTPSPAASACSDGDACTLGDGCQGGQCLPGGGPRSCDDNNLCTTDSCDAKKGCLHKPATYLCDDGDPCTSGDLCSGGQCKGEPLSSCSCASDGDCAGKNDANLCNGQLKCVQGSCRIDPATVVVCADSGPCASTSCEASTGKCSKTNVQAGLPCQDGSACTQADQCDGQGACKGKIATVCDDGNPCTADACSAINGCVSAITSSPCDDGDTCSGPDVCANGQCQPGANVCACSKDDDCAKVAGLDKCKGLWTCDTANGSCEYDPSKVVKCSGDGKNPCVINACEPSTGQCASNSLAKDTPCDDGLYCTVLDRCGPGGCSGDANPCSDGLACTADSCKEDAPTTAEACSHDAAILEKLPCNDGSLCTSGDACTSGYCVGKPGSCDDKNPCTVDACDMLLGCTYLAAEKATACSDGNACSGDPAKGSTFVQDGCDGFGKCAPGEAKVCGSDNPCVEIPCNPTAVDVQPGIPLGCEQKKLLDGKSCDDGNACTNNDLCQVGLCAPGTETSCDDGNSCTTDDCEAKSGCNHANSTAPCSDQDPCTDKDACGGGTCKGVPATCDDENVCTADSCDPKAGLVDGCVHKPAQGDCGNFAACSTAEVPQCAFKAGHLVISEVYVGVPGDPSDDWVEIHNPTNQFAKLDELQLEARPVDADAKVAWKGLAKGKSGVLLAPKGYALFAASAVLQGGVVADTVSAELNLALPLINPPGTADCFVDSLRHLQLRLRDPLHQLEHDRIAWDDGQAQVLPKELQPVDASTEAWPAFTSIERKASGSSDVNSMYPHKAEWLAGNAEDSGVDSDDFLVRWWPEPQSQASGKFEPACGGLCPLTKICNFKVGADTCVDDSECKSFGASAAAACGPGKVCGAGLSQCLADPQGTVVISEVFFGDSGEQFVELYNASAKTISVGGWKLQRKNPENEQYLPWINTLVTLPAGTVLPAKRYLLIGTQQWARTHGQTDVVVPVAMVEQGGGALRLWDPASDAEVDLLGWGNAKAFSNASTGGIYKAAPAPKLGQSLERKAKSGSTSGSMSPGGGDDLQGNSADTSNDSADFVINDPSPQTFGAAVFEPACGGSCAAGLVCNYLIGGGQACVDPLCGVPCDLGLGCNPVSGVCDLRLLVAEVATDGLQAKDQNGVAMSPANNEYVVLYNPSPSSIMLSKVETIGGIKTTTDALILQAQALASTSWGKLTDNDLKKLPLSGSVAPYSFYLVAPPSYDASLPLPDYLSATPFGLDGNTGAVRIARLNGTYPWGSGELDRVAWGAAKAKDGEGKTAVEPQVSKTCATGQGGALRRLAQVGGAAQVADPFSGAFYAGASRDTNDNGADWVRVAQRRPRSQKCSQPEDIGANKPFCAGYPLAQRP